MNDEEEAQRITEKCRQAVLQYMSPSLVDFHWVTWDYKGHSYLSKGYCCVLSQICGVILYLLSSWYGLMSAVSVSVSEFDGFELSSPRQARCGTVILGTYRIYSDQSKYVRGAMRPSDTGEKWQLTLPDKMTGRLTCLNIWDIDTFFLALYSN